MDYCPKLVTKLKENEVFVFGSNASGFHGAGTAGFAFRGEAANTWRNDESFKKAMRAPKGSSDRIGKWAVYGIGKGYQEGRDGASYAIQTVVKPGARRSIPLEQILSQFRELARFAERHPEKKFYMTISGGGYNGYTVEEIRSIYRIWCMSTPPPKNILIKKEYEFRK